jgi:mono/diheme cytochrome c family protein
MRRHAPLAVLAAALLAAGCGGGGSDDGGGGGGGGGGAQATTGEALFKGNCGSCHTLAAAGTNGSFGPNLDELKPDEQTVLTTIKNGPGPMPANVVKGADAQKVAAYVADNAGS